MGPSASSDEKGCEFDGRNDAHSGSQSKPAIDDEDRDQTAQSQHPTAAPDENPTGLKLLIIIVGLQLAVLCVALDNTIIATAIPRITDEFQALSDVGWYGSAYLLPLSAFQLFFGRLYSVFNIKWTFMFALLVFEVGSLVCATAPSSTALIVGRAIAGLGSAGLFNGTLIILAHNTRVEKRPLLTSIITSMYALASIVGPLLGGVLTDHATWRWCFYVNLPLGTGTAVALVFFLKSVPGSSLAELNWKAKIARFDPLGTVLFIPCVVCLLLALQWGGTTYAWNNGRIIALFVVFGITLAAFLAVQAWMKDNATIPMRITLQRNIIASALFMFCNGAAYFIMIYYVPIWFQAIHQATATQSGIDTLPLMISNILAAIFAGSLVTIWGYYTPFAYSLVVVGAIGAGLMTTWTVDVSTGKWIGYQILFGAGIGLGQQQGFVAAQASLPLADVPTGTSVVMFAQMFGGSVFLSVAQNIFTGSLVDGLRQYTSIDPQTVLNTGATGLAGQVTDSALLRVVQVVYNSALTKAFEVALILTCFSAIGAVCLEWKSVKSKKEAGESVET